ncbi:MAG: hypothetical protein ICV66_12825 [Chitinophagaceae bacterium]|nr:hypothetical protein [Chitinophagaceae bacterium]
MKRRDFFKTTGLLSFSFLLPLQKIRGNNFSNDKIWIDLIDYARWCPSPHNVQPWKMKIISATEAHLYYDPSRVPFVVDSHTSFTTVGMGMFVECLNIAANSVAYKIVASMKQKIK